MFRIFAFGLLAVTALCFPPLTLIALPLMIIWASRLRRLYVDAHREIDPPTINRAELERLRAVRSW